MRDFEIVISVQNEEKSLLGFLESCIETAKQNNVSPQNFQFLIVNNGSTDQTRTLLSALSQTEKGIWFRFIESEDTKDSSLSFYEGLKATNSRHLAWALFNNSHCIQDAFNGWNILKSQDRRTLVQGAIFKRTLKSKMIGFAISLFSKLILGLRVDEISGQPKIFDRGLVEYLKTPPAIFSLDIYMLYIAQRLGYFVKTFPVRPPPLVMIANGQAHSLLGYAKYFVRLIRCLASLRLTHGTAAKKL